MHSSAVPVTLWSAQGQPVAGGHNITGWQGRHVADIYRVSIKSFPDYKHLLQENYCMWNTNIFFQNVTQEVFLQHISTL